MVAMRERADVFIDDDIYPEPVTSIEQVYRMLQEGEDSIAQGRVFTKEEALKRIEIESNL